METENQMRRGKIVIVDNSNIIVSMLSCSGLYLNERGTKRIVNIFLFCFWLISKNLRNSIERFRIFAFVSNVKFSEQNSQAFTS